MALRGNLQRGSAVLVLGLEGGAAAHERIDDRGVAFVRGQHQRGEPFFGASPNFCTSLDEREGDVRVAVPGGDVERRKAGVVHVRAVVERAPRLRLGAQDAGHIQE